MSGRWEETKFQLTVEWQDLRNYPRWWLLLSGNRLLIAGVALFAVFLGFWGAVIGGLVPLREQTATLYLLFTLTSGNITLITIVVSLNQLILTRHLESPSDISDEMSYMRTYRGNVSNTIRRNVTPVRPSEFFLLLFRSLRQDLRSLDEREWTLEDELVEREFDGTFAELDDHITEVIELLEESEAGLVFALFTTVSADYERYMETIWRLQYEHGEQLPDAASETVARVRNTIEDIGIARRIFKTTYIESELASLSRRLLYIGLPALLGTMLFMLSFTASTQASIGPALLSVAVPVLSLLASPRSSYSPCPFSGSPPSRNRTRRCTRSSPPSTNESVARSGPRPILAIGIERPIGPHPSRGGTRPLLPRRRRRDRLVSSCSPLSSVGRSRSSGGSIGRPSESGESSDRSNGLSGGVEFRWVQVRSPAGNEL
jgi:hypothetical protein